MGVFSEILIQIPKERNHITGEPLQGIVKFHLDKDTVYKKISLSLVEKGSCEWLQNYGKTRRYVRGKESIVIQKIYLLNETSDGNTTLTAGSYQHPFEMIIPENIPPTMKSSIGEIKYNIVLKFKKPETFSWNQTFKKYIKIYPRIDSSMTEDPIFATRDKTLYKLLKKYEINLKAELDKGYLTPNGERKITFVVNNKSDVIFSVKTELISKTKYTAEYSTKTKTKVIHSCTVETPSIPDNSVSNMFNIIPVAPELCTVRHSDVINREYKLRVTFKLPLPHINSSVEIPVFVGEQVTVNYGEAAESSEPIENPPSYWEAMDEDESKE